MKRMKKTLAVILAAVMVAGLLPIAYANDIVDSGTCGDNLTWSLDSEGTLIISGEGEMPSYENSTSPWHYRSEIKAIEIESGVTNIGDRAFSSCSNLQQVTIPDSVTSIGKEAFYSCHDLDDVIIPNHVSAIGESAFDFCSSLTEITIPDSVSDIGISAFRNCQSLATVDFGNGVTTIHGEAFWGCNSLTTIHIPSCVTTINQGAFSDCPNLTSITVDADSTSFKADNGVLYSYDSRLLLCYPMGKTDTAFVMPSTVTTIASNAFYGSCLEEVTISENVTKIYSHCFEKCANLHTVHLPSELEFIDDNAFEDCTSLSGLVLPAGIEGTGYRTFHNCTSLTSITIPASLTYIYASFESSGLTSVTFADGMEAIPFRAMWGCRNLSTVIIPDSVTEIGDEAFYDCISLESIDIPSGVTDIGDWAFYECTSLKNIDIPDGVTVINYESFGNCSSLEAIDIPNNVTTIEMSAFSQCAGLTSIVIPNKVTSIGNTAFLNCTGLTTVTIHPSVSVIESRAFEGCLNITDVYYYGTEDEWDLISIASGNECLTNAVIHFLTAGEWFDNGDGTHSREITDFDGVTSIETKSHKWSEWQENGLNLTHECLLCDASESCTCSEWSDDGDGTHSRTITHSDGTNEIQTKDHEWTEWHFVGEYMNRECSLCDAEESIASGNGYFLSAEPSSEKYWLTFDQDELFSYNPNTNKFYYYLQNPGGQKPYIAYLEKDAETGAVKFANEYKTFLLQAGYSEEDISNSEAGLDFEAIYFNPPIPESNRKQILIGEDNPSLNKCTDWYMPVPENTGNIQYEGYVYETENGNYILITVSENNVPYANLGEYFESSRWTTVGGSFNINQPLGHIDENGDGICDRCYDGCNHDVISVINYVAASCTEDGYSGDEVCLVCGEVITEGEVVPALGHIDENPEDDICDRCGEIYDYGYFLDTKISTEKYWLATGHFTVSYNPDINVFFEYVDYIENGTVPYKQINVDKGTVSLTNAYRSYMIAMGFDPEEVDSEINSIESNEDINDYLTLFNPPVPSNTSPKSVYPGEENCPNKCTDWYFDGGFADGEVSVFESQNGNYIILTNPEFAWEEGHYTDEIVEYQNYGAYVGSDRYNSYFAEELVLHEPTGHIDENDDNVCDRCGKNVLYIFDRTLSGFRFTLDSEGTLTISGTGTFAFRTTEDSDMLEDVRFMEALTEYCLSVRHIVISEGITEIASSEFGGNFPHLISVSYPSTYSASATAITAARSYVPEFTTVYVKDKNGTPYYLTETLRDTLQLKEGCTFSDYCTFLSLFNRHSWKGLLYYYVSESANPDEALLSALRTEMSELQDSLDAISSRLGYTSYLELQEYKENPTPRDPFTVYGYPNSKQIVDNYNEMYEGGAQFISLCQHENTIIAPDVDPTCLMDGYTGRVVCEDCGEVINEGAIIDALDHIDENDDDYCDRCGALVNFDYYLTTGVSNERYWLCCPLDLDANWLSRITVGYYSGTNCFYIIEPSDAGVPFATLKKDIATGQVDVTDEYMALMGENEDPELVADSIEFYVSFFSIVFDYYINPPVPAGIEPKTAYIGEENCPNRCTDWYVAISNDADLVPSTAEVYEAAAGDYLLITVPVYGYEVDETTGEGHYTDEIEDYIIIGDYIGNSRWEAWEEDVYVAPVAPLGHIDANPEDGICDRCGAALEDVCQHANTEIRNAVTGTCVTEGYSGDTWCLDCNTKIADGTNTGLDATNHEGGTEVRGVVTGTCVTEGYTGDTYCLGCNTKIETGTNTGLDASNHEGETEVRGAVTGTCVTEGYTGDLVCLTCGATLEPGSVDPAKGHDFSGEARKNDDGLTHSFKCVRCDAYGVGTAENAAEGCAFGDWVPGQSATCYTDGAESRVCSVCGREETKTLPAHHTLEKIDEVPATCEADGSEACWRCSVCGAYFADADATAAIDAPVIIPAPGHDWGEWTKLGSDKHTRVCANDPTHTQTADHNWQLVSSTAPDCTTPGDAEYQCPDCGATKTVTGEALGHGHTEGFLEDDVPSTCKAVGYYMKVCLDCLEIVEEHDYDPAPDNHVGGTEIRDAREATCSVEGYTGDTYCKGCGAKIAEGEPIPTNENHVNTRNVEETDSTCVAHGYTAGVYCDDCHKYISGHAEKELADHIWNDGAVKTPATCVAEGTRTFTCTVCGETEDRSIPVDSANHAGPTEIRDAREATCSVEGYTGDTYCKACDTKIAEGEPIAINENHVNTRNVDETDSTCVAHGYTAGVYCDDCHKYISGHAEKELADHIWNDGAVKTPATCVAEGTRTFTCTVCGETEDRSIPVDSTNHAGPTEIRDAREATCSVEGYTGDTYCKACDTKIAEGEPIAINENHVNTRNVDETDSTCVAHGYTAGVYCDDCHKYISGHAEKELADHIWNDGAVKTPATCVAEGTRTFTCTVCGETEDRSISIDGNNHVNVRQVEETDSTCVAHGYTAGVYCDDCHKYISGHAEKELADHIWNEGVVKTPATCVAEGTRTFTCTVCGETEDRSIPVDSANHTGRTEIINAKDATCTEPGYVGDVICSDCKAVLVPGTPIGALGHDWSEWTVTVEASYLHDGEKTRSCSRCQETGTEKIDRLEPENTKTDGETGLDVGFDDDVLPADTQVVVDREYDGVAFSFLNSVTRKFEMFNITLVRDGQPVQPNGKVRVRIPLPEGYNPKMTRVYYVATDGSGKQLLDSVIEDGYIVFETTHFSDYAIVDETPDDPSEGEKEPNCVCGKNHSGPFAWVVKIAHKILYFFKNLFRKK